MNETSEKVLLEAAQLNGGDTSKALEWYFKEPLREFGGQTAATAVNQGREADVLRLLEMYEAAASG